MNTKSQKAVVDTAEQKQDQILSLFDFFTLSESVLFNIEEDGLQMVFVPNDIQLLNS